MKNLITFILLVFSLTTFSQNVAINSTGSAADGSAMLDVQSTDKGFLVPRLTAAARTSIASPATGLLVYQSDGESGFYYFDGSDWITFLDDKKGWRLDGNAGTDPVNEYIGTSDAVDWKVRTNATDRFRILSGGPAIFNNTTTFGSTVLSTWSIGTDNAFEAISEDGAAVLALTEGGDGLFVDRSADDAANFAAVWGQSAGRNAGVFLNNQTNTAAIALDAQIIGTGNFDATAVQGISNPALGWGVGGRFVGGWRGVWATTPTGTPFGGAAVYAEGDLVATGVKSFEIDHPLDPENKLLRHFAIESNEVLNHYRGIAVFDENGAVTITLPDYFEAINRSVSYQLAAVGAAMPELHIRSEIDGNSFVIAGGKAGKKVSWIVEAERNDKYLQTSPEKRSTVLDKKEIYKGEYFDSYAYGVEREKSYSKVRQHQMKKTQKEQNRDSVRIIQDNE